MASDLDWAWLAGLFEGEGCIGFTGKNSVCLWLCSVDRDVIVRAHDVLNAGDLRERPAAAGRTKPLHCWQIGRAIDVRDALENMLPWFGERRRARAIEALARLKLVRREGYCSRGHLMEGDNLYVSPKGVRQCIACRLVREQDRKPRNGGRVKR